MTKQEKVTEIIKRLYKVYPHPKIALKFENPYQLLIATILSAQTTDVSVNLATPNLFKKYPEPENLAKAPIEEIDQHIKNINFHNNKAKTIKACAQMLIGKFQGKVPSNMKDLDSLPGVARKTANVVLGSAFGKAEGIVVDTHVIRLANKLGLTSSKEPVKIEQDLMAVVSKKGWINLPLMLILHGREICTARPHACQNCPLGDLCPCYIF
ncbi:MAG: endonuclease III [Microgenomates group bacterium Gr01-1014_7]|nr:MAG: endonuclease III [Microgenomates group bacterium Gr01-1014_7]